MYEIRLARARAVSGSPAGLAVSVYPGDYKQYILAWQFVLKHTAWHTLNGETLTDDCAVFSEQPVDSRQERECASGCERKLSSGAAEDSPAGGRGRDDLRAAGGRSVRPRHTKAVCVHCWILSTFSNAYTYISIYVHIYVYLAFAPSHLAETWYSARKHLLQQKKTTHGYYTTFGAYRSIRGFPAYIYYNVTSLLWHWRLREIPLRFPEDKNRGAVLPRLVRGTERKKTVVRIRLIDDKFYWNMYNDAMTCEEFAQRLRYRFSLHALSFFVVVIDRAQRVLPGRRTVRKEKDNWIAFHSKQIKQFSVRACQ